MLRNLPPLALVALSATSFAQMRYDAGYPGNPPEAPSSTTQGWSESITGACSVSDVSPDPDVPVNAWQINDPGSGQVLYEKKFNGTGHGYEVEIVMRHLADQVYLFLDAGWDILDNSFELFLTVEGSDVRIDTLQGETLYCPNGADGAYHRYKLVSGYGWNQAEVWFDHQYLGDIAYFLTGVDPVLVWGTTSQDAGRARIHSVVLRDLLGTSYCGPAVPHSGGFPARLLAEGIGWVSSNDLRLVAYDLPTNQFGYLLASQTQGFVQNPGGSQGNLCLGGQIGRFVQDLQSSGPVGRITVQVDLTHMPPPLQQVVHSGETWSFQTWFRDLNPGATSNFTDGVAVTFF